MQMGEPLGLGEHRHVGLHAAGDLDQRPRRPAEHGSELRGLGPGQVGDGEHVSAGQDHQPARQRAVEGVGDPPVVTDVNSLEDRDRRHRGI